MGQPEEIIRWFEPSFDAADMDAVRGTVERGFVNEGPCVRAFEDQLRAHFGVAHAIATPSGTTALALSIMALGIGPGDTVLIPDITFIGCAGAVRLAGAEPILVDVDPATYTMDPAHAEARLRPDTRAIMAVHLNGRGGHLSELLALGRAKGIPVIEDAAEAVGSRNRDGFLGVQGAAGCFSLAPTKIITSGQGGFILTNSAEIRDAVIRLKDHGRLSRASDEHPVTGFNFKVTDMQGALAGSQWTKLPDRIARSLAVDRLYREGLAEVPGIRFAARPGDGGYLMWPDFACDRRDELVENLRNREIHLRPFWPPIHTQPAYRDATAAFAGATETAATACWLPSSPAISDEEIRRVCAAIAAFSDA